MINYDEQIDNYLRKLVKEHPRSYFKTIKAKKNKKILQYINDCTPLLSNSFILSTKVYWVINHIQEFPKCKICGKEIKKNIKINEKYPTHCSAKCLSDDPEVQKRKECAYQNKYGEGITNPFQAKEVIEKITQTHLSKYNTKRFTQAEAYKIKISKSIDKINESKYQTHKSNNSFNDSKEELLIYDILKQYFKCVKRHYKSDVYPFECDFYIDEIDTYIEYNGTWTHGGHPFDETNEKDIEIVEFWKSKNTKYYNNAIYTWTLLDTKKRQKAKENNLKYIEFWNFNDVFKWLKIDPIKNLLYPFNKKKINRDIEYYKHRDANMLTKCVSHKNEIIKYFQQDTFFKKEKELWKNDEKIREKLIANRIKYLNKKEDELTVDDILTGFKKSGIYYGYSHFNPLWFKWFLTTNNIQSCYDPCGGWGHRLLGALNIQTYIYNDLSKSTKENIDKMIEYFKLKNIKTYNNDASTFIPEEDFEAMFTCPPYYNVEEYECGKFENKKSFDDFLKSIFNIFYKKDSCKIFGIVIREDLMIFNNYDEKHILNENYEKYLDDKKNNFNEYLYIFKK
jgi:hypothetical protein